MIAEDLDGIGGITDELRTLMMEMLDPEPGRRPEVRSVARRLRQVIPQQDGLWLSAWAESVIGLPVRQAPEFVMPTPTMVTEDFSPDDVDEEDGKPSASVEANRKLVSRAQAPEGVRWSPARVVAAVAFAALLVMGVGSSWPASGSVNTVSWTCLMGWQRATRRRLKCRTRGFEWTPGARGERQGRLADRSEPDHRGDGCDA